MEAKQGKTTNLIIFSKFLLPIIFSLILLFINTSSSILNTILYSMAMVPLAIMLGNQTSNITEYIGERKGGLLAATIGNIPELMMGLWSVKYGMIGMAKAGLMGAVITNMLLGLGLAVFLGGIHFKEQKFNKIIARTNFHLLFLAISSVIIISSLNKYAVINSSKMVSVSVIVSCLLVGIYVLGLIFSLYTHKNLFIVTKDRKENNYKKFEKEALLILLTMAMVSTLLYFVSEKLIFNVNNIVENYNISQEFIGIILIPLLGSFGENAASIVCAIDNKIDCSLETAIGSSIQISLFVIPLLIICSAVMGLNMTLVFSTFQIIMLIISVAMSYFVFQDGKTYWLEGGVLTVTYIIITIAYYYIG